VSDDLTGAQPPPPNPPPAQPPVFLPPQGVSPTPAQGLQATGADAWPWYFGLLTLAVGIFASLVVSLVLGGFWIAAGGKVDDASFYVLTTAIQAFIFVGSAVGIARTRGRVTPRDFGLVRAPFWPTVGRMIAVMASYLVLLGIYNSLVHLAQDDTPDKLGASSGVLGMLCFGILVAVLAPIAEEIFFRGMIFRSFSNKLGIVGGAIASGILFGALHIDSLSSDRLLQVVPLAVLGILFALCYAWTGTLYSTIALHATNNSLAVLVYAQDHNSDFGVALACVLWVLMMIGCTLGWRLTDRGGESAPPAAPHPAAPVPAAPQPYFQHAAAPPPPAAPPAPPPSQPPAQPPVQYPPPPDHPDFPFGRP